MVLTRNFCTGKNVVFVFDVMRVYLVKLGMSFERIITIISHVLFHHGVTYAGYEDADYSLSSLFSSELDSIFVL